MRHSVFAGGKRLRPILCMEMARMVARGDLPPGVEDLGAAIEMLHTYSLIHDDLPALDNDDLRRGKPTCHVVYGEDVAILAGDGLFAEAIKLVLDEQDGEPDRVLRALRHLVAAISVSGMVGGQYVDVKETAPHDEAGLRQLHALKTGRLIAAAIECPLLLFGAGEAATMGLRRFAAELGVLFQIVDDILDVTGTDDALGKPRGSDERHGKRTYVSQFGIDRARELAAESCRMALDALAEAAGRSHATAELEGITDFIYTRTS
jgi:geranylgeranyl diphosphate synthase type II